jgi:hypothetical protein
VEGDAAMPLAAGRRSARRVPCWVSVSFRGAIRYMTGPPCRPKTTGGAISAREHFGRLARLLERGDSEGEWLVEQTRRLSGADAKRTGNSLVTLVVRNEDVALGGRVLFALGKRDVRQACLGTGSVWPRRCCSPSSPRDTLGRPHAPKVPPAGAASSAAGTPARFKSPSTARRSRSPAPPRSGSTSPPTSAARRRQRAALELAARAERARLARLAELCDVLLVENSATCSWLRRSRPW